MAKSSGDALEERDGQEPLEEVPAEQCETIALKAEVGPGERDGPPHESQHQVVDEVIEQYVPGEGRMGLSPVDGLPIPLDESPNLALAPAFSIENVLCLEDTRGYVEVFEEHLRPHEIEALARLCPPSPLAPRLTLALVSLALAAACAWILLSTGSPVPFVVAGGALAFAASRVLRASPRTLDGTTSRYDAVGREKQAAVYLTAVVKGRFGAQYVRVGNRIVVVRPRRERCENYARQMFANDDVPDKSAIGHSIIFRNCTRRRSVGGAFMSLRDEAVYACDYRDPPAPESARILDAADANILKRSAERTLVPLFNLTSKKRSADALAQVAITTDAATEEK